MAGLHVRVPHPPMEEYKNGNRIGLRATTMIEIAKAITDEEVRAASEYYAKLKPHSRQKVVESATAPKSFVGGGGMRYAHAEGGTEPIGSRIILIPDTAEGAQRRNPKSNFVAYVPEGSIANGKALAEGGGGKTIACGICHGPALKGLGDVPGIAGRDPIYTFRQLYDMQQGRRKGDAMALMKAVVEKLTRRRHDRALGLLRLARAVAAVGPERSPLHKLKGWRPHGRWRQPPWAALKSGPRWDLP